MPDERRYPDDEIREIFALAAAPRVGPPSRAIERTDGLTLAELQEIGREAGLDPVHVAEAAVTLELRRGALPRRTTLGMPTGVGRIVTLPRAPTDREWAQLVAELRATFDATGVDRSTSDVRQWANGNLRAAVEPAESGHRLRLHTRKGDAASLNALGVVGLVMSLLLLFVLGQEGWADRGALLAAIVLGLSGGGTLAYNALRLPAWARTREEQMEHVAARAVTLLGPPPASPLPGEARVVEAARDRDAARAGDGPA